MLSQIEKSIKEITYLTKKLPEEAFKTISINQKETIPFKFRCLSKNKEILINHVYKLYKS